MQSYIYSGVFLLEGKYRHECTDKIKNCIPCYLPIKRAIYLELAVVTLGYKCFVCRDNKGASTMLLCDLCEQGCLYGMSLTTINQFS